MALSLIFKVHKICFEILPVRNLKMLRTAALQRFQPATVLILDINSNVIKVPTKVGSASLKVALQAPLLKFNVFANTFLVDTLLLKGMGVSEKSIILEFRILQK